VSFLSGQYGLAGDNVVEYETVLANGSIVNFGQERHPEIVRAMRGAGSQFGTFKSPLRLLLPVLMKLGIVTKFTVKSYPIGKVSVLLSSVY
jgi:FAD/FMN-containing dehydrogenase